MASAQTTAQKELFLSKLQVKGEEFQLGGLGTERSQFLTESKHKEIVECLAEWESRSDNKKERLSKFPQGYAWRNKYALFGPDDSAVLIFNPEFVGRGKQKEALPTAAAAPAAAQALDEAQVVSHVRAESLRTCSRSTLRAGTARLRHSASVSSASMGRASRRRSSTCSSRAAPSAPSRSRASRRLQATSRSSPEAWAAGDK